MSPKSWKDEKYCCGLKVTYTHQEDECHGNIGLAIICLNGAPSGAANHNNLEPHV